MKSTQDYYFLPCKRDQQYHDALQAELSSLLLLHLKNSPPGVEFSFSPPILPLYCTDPASPAASGATPQGLSFKGGTSKAYELIAREIAANAVSFSSWKAISSAASAEELCSSAATVEQLNLRYSSDCDNASAASFLVEIYSFGRKLSKKQKTKLLNMLTFNKSNGTVGSKSIHQLCLILEHSSTSTDACGLPELLRVHLCGSLNDNKGHYSPKAEVKLSAVTSATSLRPLLCKLTCNLAQVQSTSLCLDLCCGTGRLMEAMDGVTLGSDAIHHFVPFSEDRKQTGRCNRNFCLANIYNIPYVAREQFDCLVCDPPYGRREIHVDAAGVDAATHCSNHERALAQFQILTPLLAAAAKLLRLGGRLVFLFIK